MINGIINVYKEAGFTSFDVVAKLRGITGQKKIGHTGTLDPDAEGVLPVCLGSATKLCEYLTDKTKEYKATLRLGIETDTQDISGRVLDAHEVNITREELIACIKSFEGMQQQIPPMYSAIKIEGKKLYELAREGKTVDRKPRDIEIFGIEIEDVDEKNNEVTVLVECSKGTYIRTLCYDIGRKLGCGATMTKLLRTRSGNFCLKDALTLEQIEDRLSEVPREIELPLRRPKPVKDTEEAEGEATVRRVRDPLKVKAALADITIPVDSVFAQHEEIIVEGENFKRVINGNYVNHSYCGEVVRIYDSSHRFLAVYEYSNKNKWYKPQKMFLEE